MMKQSLKTKVVVAARQLPPPKMVKDAQCILILLVFFELHTTQTKCEKDVFVKALKYFEQNVKNFVKNERSFYALENFLH